MPSLTDADDDNDDDEVEEQLQPKPPPPQPHCSEWLWKPSCIIWDLQSGEGVTLTHKGPGKMAISLQMPGTLAEESKEAGGVWAIVDSTPTLLKDFEGPEHTFLAKTANSEALEPHMLTEAKRRPNWLQ